MPITIEMIDALIAKYTTAENERRRERGEAPLGSTPVTVGGVVYPSGIVPPERAVSTAMRDGRALVRVPVKSEPAKRMDPAIQMRKEMNRLGIKSDDKRQFTIDLAGRLMYYGDDHIPRYVETGTRTPPDSPHSMPAIEPSPIKPAKAQRESFQAATSSREESRIKAKRWKRGDKVQVGEGDEHDTGEVVSALEHVARVKWNKANAIFNEDPQDLEWWDGLTKAEPTEDFASMPHDKLLDRADELRSEPTPAQAWWCNTCEGGFNLTPTDEATFPCCPACGESTAVHEVAKSRWVKQGRTRTSEPPKTYTTPQGFTARVVTPQSTEDKLHEWHETHGREMSLPKRG